MTTGILTILAAILGFILLAWQLIDTFRDAKGKQRQIKLALAALLFALFLPLMAYEYFSDRNQPKKDAEHRLKIAIQEMDLQLMSLDTAVYAAGSGSNPREITSLQGLMDDIAVSGETTDAFLQSSQQFLRSQKNIIEVFSDDFPEDQTTMSNNVLFYRIFLEEMRAIAMIESMLLTEQIDGVEAGRRRQAAKSIAAEVMTSNLFGLKTNFALIPKASNEADTVDPKYFCMGYTSMSALLNSRYVHGMSITESKLGHPVIFSGQNISRLNDDPSTYVRVSGAAIEVFFGEVEGQRFLSGVYTAHFVKSVLDDMSGQNETPKIEGDPSTSDWFLAVNEIIAKSGTPVGTFGDWSAMFGYLFMGVPNSDPLIQNLISRLDGLCT